MSGPPLSNVLTPGKGGRVFGLDLLRTGAILGVVLAHGFVVLYPHMPPWFGLLGHGGFYGVELFFVLSGFLIGRILIGQGVELSRASSVGKFYLRRWFRTLPLFLLFLIVNVALENWLRHHSLSLSEIGTHGLFLRNFASNQMSFFAESWSLAIEEWFYLLLPALLWLGLLLSKRFDPVFLTVVAGFFVFSTVGRMHSALDPAATWDEWQRKIVLYRFDSLMTGILAAWISVRFPQRWRKHNALYAIIGLLLLAVMYSTLWKIDHGRIAFGDDSYFARTFRFTCVSVGFALLLPAAANWRLSAERFWSVPIRKIALWSYSLYLVHLPLFDLILRMASDGWHASAMQALILFTVQIGLVMAAAAFLYHFFEKPCTDLRERFAANPS